MPVSSRMTVRVNALVFFVAALATVLSIGMAGLALGELSSGTRARPFHLRRRARRQVMRSVNYAFYGGILLAVGAGCLAAGSVRRIDRATGEP